MKIWKTLAIMVCCLCLTACWETSKGEKIGIIVKCAKTGVLVKTLECELIRGGMADGSGSMGKSFHFTVENMAFEQLLLEAMDSQKQVKIAYHQEFLSAPWRTETKDASFLDNIKFIN
jgi:hypothetical protein